jgi:hypothetical protein
MSDVPGEIKYPYAVTDLLSIENVIDLFNIPEVVLNCRVRFCEMREVAIQGGPAGP